MKKIVVIAKAEKKTETTPPKREGPGMTEEAMEKMVARISKPQRIIVKEVE